MSSPWCKSLKRASATRCRQMPSLPNADVSQLPSCRGGGGLTAVLRSAEYAFAMSTLVLRKSLDDERVSGPYSCASLSQMVRVPGLLTLEERMPWLLAKHETARYVDGQRKIYRGQEVVGYLVVLSND